MAIGVAHDPALHGVSAVLVDPVEAALTRARGEIALARLGRLVDAKLPKLTPPTRWSRCDRPPRIMASRGTRPCSHCRVRSPCQRGARRFSTEISARRAGDGRRLG